MRRPGRSSHGSYRDEIEGWVWMIYYFEEVQGCAKESNLLIKLERIIEKKEAEAAHEDSESETLLRMELTLYGLRKRRDEAKERLERHRRRRAEELEKILALEAGIFVMERKDVERLNPLREEGFRGALYVDQNKRGCREIEAVLADHGYRFKRIKV